MHKINRHTGGPRLINLTSKVAFVTGGAAGIGRGISAVLSKQGAHLVIADVNIERAKSTAEELSANGIDAIAINTDVTSRTSVQHAVEESIEKFGQVDILVNNAGVIGGPPGAENDMHSDEAWDWNLSVNLRGVVNTTEAIAQYMKKLHYGKIVNVLSGAARRGEASGTYIYCASKAGALSFTQSSALTLAPYNINVNAICPGHVWTPMSQRSGRRYEDFEQRVSAVSPMGRPQTPEDMGNLVAFLVSDEAQNITGQAINIDGGQVLN